MAQSKESRRMKEALQTIAVPKLRRAGFKGSYPHFRRVKENQIDLVSFLGHSQWGGAFEVGASIIFPNAACPEDTNYFFPNQPIDIPKLTWAHGRIRTGLPGTYDNAFYYADLYSETFTVNGKPCTRYIPVTPAFEEYLQPQLRYQLVQKANDRIYEQVAQTVFDQLDDLLDWFDEISSIDKLRLFDMHQMAVCIYMIF